MKTEEKILRAFLYNNKLKFNEIEKLVKERSNKLAYSIKILIKKGILIKEKDFYSLSETSEYLIPYLSEKKSVLPVILIKIKKQDKIFLYKREKRPFKNKLSLPGGRLLLGESIEQAVKRIMKEKFNINSRLKQINSISLEHVKKNKKIIHSFLLILVEAISKDSLIYLNPEKNKKNIISSDYKLLKDTNQIKIKQIFTNTK